MLRYHQWRSQDFILGGAATIPGGARGQRVDDKEDPPPALPFPCERFTCERSPGTGPFFPTWATHVGKKEPVCGRQRPQGQAGATEGVGRPWRGAGIISVVGTSFQISHGLRLWIQLWMFYIELLLASVPDHFCAIRSSSFQAPRLLGTCQTDVVVIVYCKS